MKTILRRGCSLPTNLSGKSNRYYILVSFFNKLRSFSHNFFGIQNQNVACMPWILLQSAREIHRSIQKFNTQHTCLTAQVDTDVQDALLKFKPSIKLWKKGDLNGFVVYLLHVFHISISKFCTELTKEVKISIELQLSRWKRCVDARDQRRMASTLQATRKATVT